MRDGDGKVQTILIFFLPFFQNLIGRIDFWLFDMQLRQIFLCQAGFCTDLADIDKGYGQA
ncbi:Uncharacterised protein [Salmonella enterica subsp. enterica serovar Typhi]|nr:hypothetical protein LTSEMIS_0283 [Salmonella enterica subsp. enterica serovar Mississippi str. A4-633]CFZ46701.1 Uncharacterised protein [Salmonella enterica subsp. enterica serovar Typhi]CRI95543.1 Uncharacterised protein [Salmonella enterica subsp. enterica serovar Typhi]